VRHSQNLGRHSKDQKDRTDGGRYEVTWVRFGGIDGGSSNRIRYRGIRFARQLVPRLPHGAVRNTQAQGFEGCHYLLPVRHEVLRRLSLLWHTFEQPQLHEVGWRGRNPRWLAPFV